MIFPKAERIQFERNPIIEVIFQMRFPTILNINTEDQILAKFQNKIRANFPIYNVQLEQAPQIMTNQIMPPLIQLSKNKNHYFISADEKWKINLASTFISFSTSSYTIWEAFKEKFDDVLKSFIDIYAPAFFERIGLRYIDAFSRLNLDLESQKWSELINPEILGFLSASDVNEDDVLMSTIDSEMRLDDKVSHFRLHAGIGKVNNTPENQYIIDSDFFCPSRIHVNDAVKKADYLHEYSTRLIRGVVKPKLSDALEPKKL